MTVVGNLKGAPIGLTADLTAKLVGDRPAYGKGIAHLPIEGTLASPERDDVDWIGGGLDF